jgi:CheY-like chemotaxis protein
MMAAKILIVEDQEANRVFLRDLLRHQGYEVLEAADGEEGIARAKADQPDLILMDIQLPRLDGVAALSRLRASPETAEIRAIALTSFAMKGDRERFFAVGFQDYLTKPTHIQTLLEAIRRILEE